MNKLLCNISEDYLTSFFILFLNKNRMMSWGLLSYKPSSQSFSILVSSYKNLHKLNYPFIS
jgi:hypothetical protein